jgi:dihydroxyacetone kinase-like protein
MKKLINSPETVVTDALTGIAAAHPSLSVDIENKVVTRASAPTAGKVGLVSGGGSGHEPPHVGFVGYGMLHAACAGEVFTSRYRTRSSRRPWPSAAAPESCTS